MYVLHPDRLEFGEEGRLAEEPFREQREPLPGDDPSRRRHDQPLDHRADCGGDVGEMRGRCVREGKVEEGRAKGTQGVWRVWVNG